MGKFTKISWCLHTFNAWIGCWKISPGCKFCYAAAMDKRWGGDNWQTTGPRRFMSETYWRQPERWAREARAAREIRTVFCSSLSDVGENRPDLVPHRQRLFRTIWQTRGALHWLLLTKRPADLAQLLPWTSDQGEASRGAGGAGPWENIWLGSTTEDMEYGAPRLATMLGDETTPPAAAAAGYFASYEPAIGPVTYTRGARNYLRAEGKGAALSWVIFGDESGHGRRPAELGWVRSVRDECDAWGVPFHFKQWHGDEGDGVGGERDKVGKIHLPILDGRIHDARPAEVTHE